MSGGYLISIAYYLFSFKSYLHDCLNPRNHDARSLVCACDVSRSFHGNGHNTTDHARDDVGEPGCEALVEWLLE